MGTGVKALWEFFVLYLPLFCKFEMIFRKYLKELHFHPMMSGQSVALLFFFRVSWGLSSFHIHKVRETLKEKTEVSEPALVMLCN